MALLQNADKDIPLLSIVETLDEYTSTTSGSGSFTHLNYSSYYNLLINACVRYDATNTSTPSKRRNVYAAVGIQDVTLIEDPHETQFSQDIDTPSDDFHQVHQANHSKRPSKLDDKSVKVGGSQCITTLDCYSFLLKCTGGLMYLSILGKPTDEGLVKYPSVHLTSIHEWDPFVLDFSYPEGDGEPVWACDPQYVDLIDPNFDSHGLYTKRSINTLSSLADVYKIPPMAMPSSTSPTQACKHQIKSETSDFDKNSQFRLG